MTECDIPIKNWFDHTNFNEVVFGFDDPGKLGTNDFRSQKDNIYYASAILINSDTRLRAESNGSAAVKMCYLKSIIDDTSSDIVYRGQWSSYTDPGDYNATEQYSSQVGAYAEFRFSGTSISFIGAKNKNLGTCDVYLDGELVAKDINLYADTKIYQDAVYQKSGLTDGEHVIRVVVSSGTIVVDGFATDESNSAGKLAMIINNEWYMINLSTIN